MNVKIGGPLPTLPRGNFPNQGLASPCHPEQGARDPRSVWEAQFRTGWRPEALSTSSFRLGASARGWVGREEAVKTMETYQGKSRWRGGLHGCVTCALCNHTGPPAQQGPELGRCHSVTISKLLMIFLTRGSTLFPLSRDLANCVTGSSGEAWLLNGLLKKGVSSGV